MLTRWLTLAPKLGNGTAAANLDLEEERTEGNAVAMPQLISVLAAMVLVFGAWEKVIERKESLEYEG